MQQGINMCKQDRGWPRSSPWVAVRCCVVIGFGLITGLGCGSNGSYDPEASNTRGRASDRRSTSREDSTRASDNRSPSIFERPVQRLSVEFSVLRISAPKGAFTQDEALWKLVTGPLPKAGSTLHLADNGFRACVGRESDRAALREFLEGLSDPKTALDHVSPDVSRVVKLEVGSCGSHRTVFYYERGGRLRGLDFENAAARLTVGFEMRSVNLKEMWLVVTPELEEPPREKKWVITPQGAREEPVKRIETFAELAFEANVPEDGFLLLGPTAAVYDRPLLGRPFFVEESVDAKEGTVSYRESVYVISPVVRSHPVVSQSS